MDDFNLRIISNGTILSGAVFLFLSGTLLGSVVMFALQEKAPSQEVAFQAARAQLDADMRKACTNWFTDKKAAQLPKGRIVVCRAPEFMSVPVEK